PVPGEIAIRRAAVGDQRPRLRLIQVIGDGEHRVAASGGEEPLQRDVDVLARDRLRVLVAVEGVVIADEDGAEAARSIVAERGGVAEMIDRVAPARVAVGARPGAHAWRAVDVISELPDVAATDPDHRGAARTAIGVVPGDAIGVGAGDPHVLFEAEAPARSAAAAAARAPGRSWPVATAARSPAPRAAAARAAAARAAAARVAPTG